MELVVATKNKKKLKEIKAILKDLRIKIKSLSDFNRIPRIIENGKTFEANAVKKAVRIAKFTGMLVLGEDSGLEVYALNKQPGIYSSRFCGYPKSDERNNRKLLNCLRNKKDRRARYFCAVALAGKNGLIKVTNGTCEGKIGFAPKGNSGFGYDPLFIIPKYNKTFAQLGPTIKHRMSHRFKALLKIRKVLEKYLEAEDKR